MNSFRNEVLKLSVLLLIILIVPLVSAQNSETAVKNNVTVYFFWGEGCPHCEEQKPFMAELESKYPELNIISLETWHNPENAQLFVAMAKAYKVSASGVPATFIGNDVPIVGYASKQSTGVIIEDRIVNCIQNGCINPISKLDSAVSNSSINITTNTTNINESDSTSIQIPVIGKVDAGKVSLPLFTIILAGLDSFNPCAFFVLLFLLSMLVYAGSRKRMLLVGGIFIFFSGLIYFLFMAAWLNVFLWAGEIIWMTLIAGLLAVVIAIINIKDFFFFKKGVSLSIPESAKPKLFSRMRNLIKESSIWSLIFGTVVLAIVANSYELLCTAGFPMVFTRMLTLNNLSPASYYMYLVLYNLVYIIPLAVIVGVFTYTLGSRKLAESEGRALKLISGMMMLILGAVLVISPNLLSNILASILMILASLLLSFALIWFDKRRRGKQKTKTN